MAINFPTAPTVNQTYEIGGTTYKWDGYSWTALVSSIDHTSLTGIGTNTHAQIDTALTRLANTSGTNTGDQVLTDIINDEIAGTATTYSGYHTQALHEAQAQAIANLSGASASFYSNTSVVIPETPAAFTNLTWTNNQASSNSDIFSLGTDEILFYKNGNYNFLTTLTYYRLSDGSTATVTYELYDADTTTVLATYNQSVDMIAGTKMTVPMNTILSISGATDVDPVRLKVRMQSTSVNGTIELFSFNSIIAAQSVVNVADLETDPVFTAWDKSTGISITESQISDLGTTVTMNSDIGVTVQAYDANLTSWAGIAPSSKMDSTNPTLVEYSETVYALSGTEIDPANGMIQTKTLSGTTTLTEVLTSGQIVYLHIIKGSNTLNFPTITWIGGTPTVAGTATSCFVIYKIGTTLFGRYLGEA